MEPKENNQPTMVIEDITPEMAKAYLATSLGNRRVPDGGKRYAEMMKQGKWMLNGVPIIFDKQNHLMDGHTRLEGIVLSGVTIRTAVVRGVSRDTFGSIDDGYRRSAKQVLEFSKIKNSKVIAGIIPCVMHLEHHGTLTKYVTSWRKITNNSVFEYYMRDAEMFDEIASLVARLKSRTYLIREAWMGALMYYLSKFGGYDLYFIYSFIEQINSIDEAQFEPCNIIRKRIIKAKLSGMKLQERTLAGLITKAWNLFVQGKNQKKLTFLDNEDMPKFALNGKLF